MIDVAVGVLVKDGQVLLGQRPEEKSFPLHWEFPGGKVQPGESILTALARELLEELNLVTIEAIPWFMESNSALLPAQFRVHYFLVTDFDGIIENRNFVSVRWFDRSSLLTAKHLEKNESAIRKLIMEGIVA